MRREFRYAALAAAVAMLSGTAAAQNQQTQQQQTERENQSGAWADSLAYDEYLAGQDLRASELIDARVLNQQGEELGRIEDLIVSRDDDVVQAVIAVGGVLGVGEKRVAVPYDELRVSRDGETLFLARTREQLEALPEFRPEDEGSRGGLAQGAAAQRQAAAQQLAAEQDETDAQRAARGQEPAEQQLEQAEQQQAAERQAEQQREQADQRQQAAERQAEQQREQADQQQQAAERQAEQQREQAEEQRQAAERQAEQQREQAEQQRPRPSAQVTVMDRADHRASELIGLTVLDSRGEEVGEIDDLVVSPEDGRIYAVLAVGGVVGIGERLISVPLEDLELSRPDVRPGEPGVAGETEEDAARLNMTSEQLIETQPEFQYSDERTASVG